MKTNQMFSWRMSTVVLLLLLPLRSFAHEWHKHDTETRLHSESAQVEETRKQTHTLLIGVNKETTKITTTDEQAKPDIARHFEHFKNVNTRWNKDTLFVESNGLPEHKMMVGITNWQQQVPLPQPFTGSNSWKIPLHPKLADRPLNAKRTPFRGAIGLAVNGVPIFSPLNNRGVDAFLAGELDKWGGHCGRGDDYHYHAAPIHLEKIVGKGNPIAFALDGFPIYGMTEADGSPVGKLDELNGQFDTGGNYHYHATKDYPYINGGIRGVVEYRNGGIASQPKDSPIRPGQSPLRGAKITDFQSAEKESVLTYTLRGKTGKITYAAVGENSFEFTYAEPGGRTWSQTYQRRSGQRTGGGGDRRGGGGPDGQRPTRQGARSPRR